MTKEDTHKFAKDGLDTALVCLGAWTKGTQAIADEMVDYARRSAECTAATWEKLLGAKSLDKAMEVQSAFAKSAYEDFVTEASKLGELYLDMAKRAYVPLEGALAKASAVTASRV